MAEPRDRSKNFKEAPWRCVLVYPSPYRVAMSSLGFQTIYRILNDLPGVCCERATLESWRDESVLRTIETGRAVGDGKVICLSVATESEIAGAARALMRAGLPPLEQDRRDQPWPIVVAGGPLTFADARPLMALADVVVVGEGEDALTQLMDLVQQNSDMSTLLDAAAALPGVIVSRNGPDSTAEHAVADEKWLPAYSVMTTPKTEFGDMFLVEAARGCPRRCRFCVMEPRRFRTVPLDALLARVPAGPRRVGLVGAALGDHPQLAEMVAALVNDGRQVSLSSLRADRLSPELAQLLRRGGARSFTVAADGASARLRRSIGKRITSEDLLQACSVARDAGLRSVKLYAMVGLPSEEDDDMRELADLARTMAAILPVTLAMSPFVPKAGTSWGDGAFQPPAVHRRRLAVLRNELRRRVKLQAASVRAAWVENWIARAGLHAGFAAVDVARAGGTYQAWTQAARLFQSDDTTVPPPP